MPAAMWTIGTMVIIGILTAAVIRRSRHRSSIEDEIRDRIAEAGPALKRKTGWWR